MTVLLPGELLGMVVSEGAQVTSKEVHDRDLLRGADT